MIDLELPLADRERFYALVWEISRQIPTSCVTTYGQIAMLIPCPEGILPDVFQINRARWAGSAMAACPPNVPWQRVINAQGKISQRRGAEMQRVLLEQEGVGFDSADRIDLAQYGWRGPTDEWLRTNGLVSPGGQLSLF
jgi:methylated-DNA-protein-cysteine methyltransferase-like protein